MFLVAIDIDFYSTSIAIMHQEKAIGVAVNNGIIMYFPVERNN